MKFWISKNSEIPVREQIVAQVRVGIASGELAVGARLPSTRELALRFGLHPNTVSHAYRALVAEGWLEFRPGSGFYVRETGAAASDSLDALIARFIDAAQAAGFGLEEIRARLGEFFDAQPPSALYVVENDPALRAILVEELGAALAERVIGVDFEQFAGEPARRGARAAALFDEKARLGAVLPAGGQCHFLRTNSPSVSMKGETRPGADALVAVVSGWDDFLGLARIMLVAAQLDPESLLIRSTRAPHWRKGLQTAAMIVCDSVTAKSLDGFPNVRVFRLVAAESIAELRQSRPKS